MRKLEIMTQEEWVQFLRDIWRAAAKQRKKDSKPKKLRPKDQD